MGNSRVTLLAVPGIDELRLRVKLAKARLSLLLQAEAEAALQFTLSGEGIDNWREVNRASKRAKQELEIIQAEYRAALFKAGREERND